MTAELSTGQPLPSATLTGNGADAAAGTPGNAGLDSQAAACDACTAPGQDPARLRSDRDFRHYWWARTLSSTGSVVTLVALPVLIFRLTGSALLTATTSAFEAAPYVAFGLLAGALSDRLDRRRVMVIADIVSTLLVLSVPAAFWLGVLTVPQVLAVAFLGPAIGVFFDGANFGAVPLLVGRSRIAEANAAIFGAATVTEMLVPSLVGISLAVIRPASLLLVDSLSFAASAMLLSRIGRPLSDGSRARQPLTRQALASEIGEGLRYLRGHPIVRVMTVVGTLQCLAAGGFVGLMVVWCDRVLRIGTSGWRFGLVYGAWSVGGLAAAVALPRLLRRVSPAAIVLAAVPCSAALGIATSMMTSWVYGAAGLLAWSAAYTLVTINTISYRQQVTPEELLGRVSTAARMISWGLGWTGGALLSGIAGDLIGVRPAMVGMTSLAWLAAASAWLSPLRPGGSNRRAARAADAAAGRALAPLPHG
jgi:MFS family permease